MQEVPDPNRKVRVFTDCRHIHQTGDTSIGAAFYQKGDLIGTYRARVDETGPFYGEVRAVIRSIDLLRFMEARRVEILTDSEPAAFLIDPEHERSPSKEKCVAYTLRARDQIEYFEEFNIEHISRNDNRLAHTLAQSALEDTTQLERLSFEQELLLGPIDLDELDG